MVDATLAIRFALAQIGKPYLWGAEGPDSFDCSGLVVKAFQTIGIDLPRTTYDMLDDSSLQPVNQGQLQPGDLVFPEAGHVQIYLGGGKVVEAPHSGANVRVTSLGSSFYAGRRVTSPASGDFSVGSGSPVAGTVDLNTGTSSTVNASDVSQAIGTGLVGTFKDLFTPVFSWMLWITEVALGVALIGFGGFLVAKKVN